MLWKLFLCLMIAALAAGAQDVFDARLAAGQAAMKQSRYGAAQKEFEAALTLSIAFPPNDPRQAQVFDALSDLNLLQGDYRSAETLERRALAIQEKATGPDSAELAAAIAKLAGILRASGKPELAEPLVLRNLATHEKMSDTAAAADLDQLAGVYQAMKRSPDAAASFRRAIEIRSAKIGPESLEVAATLIALGALYQNDVKFADAEDAFLRALAISEAHLGPESFSLVGLLDRLGLLYREQSKFAASEPYFQRGLAIRERNLGPWHSDIAPALDNLALTYYREQKYTEAEPLYKRSLSIWEATQGKNSAFVALALDNLASLYATQQMYAKAEPLFLRALAIREEQTITSLDTLALLYESTNAGVKADLFYKRALLLGENGLGGEHPEITTTMENYVTLLRALKKPAEAARIEARMKEIKAKAAEKAKPGIAAPPPAIFIALH